MNYNVSRYLNVIDLEEGALLFNGVNGCLDEISKPLAEILRSGDGARLAGLAKGDVETLIKRGHLTSLPPEEELRRFREFSSALHKKAVDSAGFGGIMLLMSYNCNLACKYCYQQEHRPHKSQAVMRAEMVDNIFEKHIQQIIPGIDFKKFDISFYGGEPFLPSNDAAVRRALHYSAKYGTRTSAISNATMVHLMPDIFGPGPGLVNRVQVSLDGSRELHDKSRVPHTGERTYDRILDNIVMMLDRKTQVSIRLNLDRRTLESVPQLIKELKAKNILGNKYASIYASPLHDNIAEVDATDFMDLVELSSQVYELGIDLEHPVSLRAHDMSYLFSLKKGIGLNRTSFCMQTLQRTLVLDPFGDLYACFEEAGYPEFRVGHVSEAGVEFFPLRDSYKDRHIANLEECLKCPVALACGGQCGVRCRAKTGDIFKVHCADIKTVILDGIKLAYQKWQKLPAEEKAAQKEMPVPSTHG